MREIVRITLRMGDQSTCTFWGVRGSTPCADKEYMEFGGNTTCVELQIPTSDELLILDSGTGIRKLGEAVHTHADDLKGRIFITHPHRDHIQGFPFFRPLYSSSNHFTIHMPKQEQGGCKAIFTEHHSKTFFPVSLDMMNARLEFINQPFERTSYNGFEVEYIKANHSTNTAMYKFHLDGSKQLVFAPDNELVPEGYNVSRQHMQQIQSFLQGVDVLIHDAQYDLKSYEYKQEWGHSAWQEVIHIARQANVSKLFLTHHDPNSDDSKLHRLDEQVRKEYGAYFESVALAKEGDSIAI